MTNNNAKSSITQRSMDVNVQSTILPFVLIDERPSPFARAEQVKREYAAKLDALLTEYEREIAASLAGEDFSEAYLRGEIDAYLARLSRVLRAHERRTFERAATADTERQKLS